MTGGLINCEWRVNQSWDTVTGELINPRIQ